jgi:hypothetical protein
MLDTLQDAPATVVRTPIQHAGVTILDNYERAQFSRCVIRRDTH